MIAVGSNNAFAINGFNGLTNAEIVSFFLMFIIFNFYVVLMAVALAAFFVTSKPRHGRVRRAAIWHFVSAVWVMLAFVSTVWGAPAEKSFVDSTAKTLSLTQPPNAPIPLGRAGMLFIGMGFAAVAIICLLIGFVAGGRQKRAFREAALAGA